jgi:hypothetical protein
MVSNLYGRCALSVGTLKPIRSDIANSEPITQAFKSFLTSNTSSDRTQDTRTQDKDVSQNKGLLSTYKVT